MPRADGRDGRAPVRRHLAADGVRLSTDAATLRRALIDEGFLERDGRGTAYRRSRSFERSVRFVDLPDWTVEIVAGEAQLVRVIKCADFAAALTLADRIGVAADAADHHPSLLVEWGRLTVRWWTHDLGGLGPKDFAMAERTDRLAAEA